MPLRDRLGRWLLKDRFDMADVLENDIKNSTTGTWEQHHGAMIGARSMMAVFVRERTMEDLHAGDTFYLATIQWKVTQAFGAGLYVTKADTKGKKRYLVTCHNLNEFWVREVIAGNCRVLQEVARGPIIKLKQKDSL